MLERNCFEGLYFSGLGDSQKDDFYDSLINVVGKVQESCSHSRGDFTGHVGSNAEDYEDQCRSYG